MKTEIVSITKAKTYLYKYARELKGGLVDMLYITSQESVESPNLTLVMITKEEYERQVGKKRK